MGTRLLVITVLCVGSVSVRARAEESLGASAEAVVRELDQQIGLLTPRSGQPGARIVELRRKASELKDLAARIKKGDKDEDLLQSKIRSCERDLDTCRSERDRLQAAIDSEEAELSKEREAIRRAEDDWRKSGKGRGYDRETEQAAYQAALAEVERLIARTRAFEARESKHRNSKEVKRLNGVKEKIDVLNSEIAELNAKLERGTGVQRDLMASFNKGLQSASTMLQAAAEAQRAERARQAEVQRHSLFRGSDSLDVLSSIAPNSQRAARQPLLIMKPMAGRGFDEAVAPTPFTDGPNVPALTGAPVRSADGDKPRIVDGQPAARSVLSAGAKLQLENLEQTAKARAATIRELTDRLRDPTNARECSAINAKLATETGAYVLERYQANLLKEQKSVEPAPAEKRKATVPPLPLLWD